MQLYIHITEAVGNKTFKLDWTDSARAPIASYAQDKGRPEGGAMSGHVSQLGAHVDYRWDHGKPAPEVDWWVVAAVAPSPLGAPSQELVQGNSGGDK